MAKILLATEEFPMPQTYREVLFAFGARYFNEDFGRKIEAWAVLRNVVAHDYLDIRWNSIKAFVGTCQPLLEDIHGKVREILLQGERKRP